MKVERIRRNLAAMAERSVTVVFSRQLGISPISLPAENKIKRDTAWEWINASVVWSGPDLRGVIALHLSKKLAAQAGEKLWGEPLDPIQPSDLVDLSRELCNMVAGSLASELSQTGFSGALETPTSPPGPPTGGWPAAPITLEAQWTCWEEPLILDVNLGPSL